MFSQNLHPIYFFPLWTGHDTIDRGRERIGSSSHDIRGVTIKTSGQELSLDDTTRQIFKPHAEWMERHFVTG